MLRVAPRIMQKESHDTIDGAKTLQQLIQIRKIRFLDRYAVAIVRWLRVPFTKKMLAVGRRLGLTKAGSSGPAEAGFGGGPELEAIAGPDFAVYFFSACRHEIQPLSIPATFYYSGESLPRSQRVAHAAHIFMNGTVEMVPGNHTTCITKHAAVLAGKMGDTLNQIFSQGANEIA